MPLRFGTRTGRDVAPRCLGPIDGRTCDRRNADLAGRSYRAGGDRTGGRGWLGDTARQGHELTGSEHGTRREAVEARQFRRRYAEPCCKRADIVTGPGDRDLVVRIGDHAAGVGSWSRFGPCRHRRIARVEAFAKAAHVHVETVSAGRKQRACQEKRKGAGVHCHFHLLILASRASCRARSRPVPCRSVAPHALDQRDEAHRAEFVVLIARLGSLDPYQHLHGIRLTHRHHHDTADAELRQ